MELIKALKSQCKSHDNPFQHWEVKEPLTNEAIKEILKIGKSLCG